MPSWPNRDGVPGARMAAARRRCAVRLHDDCRVRGLDRQRSRALPPAFCTNGAVFGRAAPAALRRILR